MNFEPSQVNTVEENATDYITKVNVLLAQNGVKDKDGNPASLKAYAGSPTWLFALAQGQNTTEWQERLRKAYFSLDIEKCDDEQVYVLATLAGVLFKEQSAPMIALTITNNEASAITINASTCYAEDTFASGKWYPGVARTLASSETETILFYCEDKQGSVPPNTTFVIKSTNASFSDMTKTPTYGSTVLFEGESAADLRNRVLLGSYAVDQITQAQNAVANLNGIVKCSIYFNPDANNSVTLPGSVSLSPRTAFICIQGVDIDGLLAETYFKYVNVQSLELVDSLRSETVVGASQLFVYYSSASEVHPKIKIYIDPTDNAINTYADYIKEILMQHKDELSIGETLTSQKICAWIDQGNKYGTITTAELSTDGTTWSETFTPSVFEVPVLQEADITFEEVSL